MTRIHLILLLVILAIGIPGMVMTHRNMNRSQSNVDESHRLLDILKEREGLTRPVHRDASDYYDVLLKVGGLPGMPGGDGKCGIMTGYPRNISNWVMSCEELAKVYQALEKIIGPNQ